MGGPLPAIPRYGIPEALNPNSDRLVPLDVWRNLFVDGFHEWNQVNGDVTPMRQFFNNLGSLSNPGVMVNAQTEINGMKSRVSTKQPCVPSLLHSDV
jgi:hypothetical protein